MADRLTEFYPDVVFSADTEESLIALTIDDGPDPNTTPRILDVLRQNDARATFFIIGERIEGNEMLLKRIVAEGHELANHLWRDEPSLALQDDEFARQLQRTHALLAPIASHPLKWFRPGSGIFDEQMLQIAKEHGYTCVLGTVYPFDAQIAWPWFGERIINWFASPGSIVILHDGGDRGLRTAATLSRALPRLHAEGLRAVSVSELLGKRPARLTRSLPRNEKSAEIQSWRADLNR